MRSQEELRDSGNQPLEWIFTDAFLATALTHVNFNHVNKIEAI